MPESIFRCENGVNIYACCLYDEVSKKLIKDLKYHGKKKISKIIADLMFEYWQSLNLKGEYTILPVPIHKSRRKERKYNHMDLVAEELSKLTKFKYNKDFLIRIKDTQKQFNLKKQERIKNIKGAFSINNEKAIDKETPILIIDDITSSGITLKEIIVMLKKEGYKNILAIAFSTPDIWN